MLPHEESRTDTELLRAFERGEVAALTELVSRHQGALHGYLVAMTGNWADADDLFQETWLRVIRRSGSFKGGAFNAWLWCIARNLLKDRFRRRKPVVSLDAAGSDEQARVEILADTRPGPVAEMITRESGQRLAEAVRRLTPIQRDVFLLRTQADMPFAEIARLLRVPLNTALARMHYAMLRLRRELETKGR